MNPASTQPATPAQPRWLDDREQGAWRAYLAMTRLVRERLERQAQQDSGMPHTYYLILAMLSEAPERCMRMSELAAIAGTSQSQLSHAASRLEESGWIERRRSRTDRRGYLAHLTDKGFEVLQAAAPGHVEAVRSTLFDPLSDKQVNQLADIAQTVLAAQSRYEA
jgi:DNA-binding MarR family transcriptional regulator